jgi:hypothetical protein
LNDYLIFKKEFKMRKKMLLTLALAVAGPAIADLPQEVFKDGLEERARKETGIMVRKGVIKGVIDSVIHLNSVLQKTCPHSINEEGTKNIKDIQEAIILLEEISFFCMFPAIDWLDEPESPGKILIGVNYLKQHPEKKTPEVLERIKELINRGNHPIIQKLLQEIC